jgi:hypothetical protein
MDLVTIFAWYPQSAVALMADKLAQNTFTRQKYRERPNRQAASEYNRCRQLQFERQLQPFLLSCDKFGLSVEVCET